MPSTPIRVYLKTSSDVVFAILQENEKRVVVWKVLPGIAIAIGADGDLLETIMDDPKDRWDAITNDGECYRAYPMTSSLIESEIAPRSIAGGFELFVVEGIQEGMTEHE